MGTVATVLAPLLPHQQMSFTPAFQKVLDHIEELVQSGASDDEIQGYFKESCLKLGPKERLNNLYRIRPKRPVPGESSRVVFFHMNRMQDRLWEERSHRDLVLKMRQGGATTMSCLRAVDKCIWEDGSNSAIMADTKDHVKEYFTISKRAVKCFQKDWGAFYQITEDVDNVNALKIKETGSSLLVCTNARGLTLDFLHIAEAAFIDDQAIQDSVEAVPLSGTVILETTADTASGMFYDLWDQSAKNPAALYKPHFFEWWVRYPEPEDMAFIQLADDFRFSDEETILAEQHNLTKEQIAWRRLKISECKGDVGEFLRKYPEDPMTCFLSGASSVFPPDVLAVLFKNERPPAFIGDIMAA